MEPINPSNVPVSATPASPVTPTPKGKSRKELGLFLIIWPIIVLIVVVTFMLVAVSYAISGVQSTSPFLMILNSIFPIIFWVCVLGIFVSLPIGIVLLVKSGGATKFSMKEAIKFGWETMKKKFWLFFAVLITMLVINIISTSLGYKADTIYDSGNQGMAAVIISIIFGVIQAIVGLGAMNIALKLVDGKEAKYGDLFSTYKLFFKYLAGCILYALIVIVGYILLIVPGIIWQFKYLLYPYFILEGAGPIEALRKSGQATKGAKADLFVFSLLLGLITIAGLIAIVVGLFFALPTVMVAMAFVYRKLQSKIVVESSTPVSPSV